MGARAELSSPLWVCIPQKSLTSTRDFWNTNSLRWTPAQSHYLLPEPMLTYHQLITLEITSCQFSLKMCFEITHMKFQPDLPGTNVLKNDYMILLWIYKLMQFLLSSGSGRPGGCQTCRTHISVTAWQIFSIRSSMKLSRPVVVHCHGYVPIYPIWACPWAQNLSNLAQIGSRLCGTQISETAGWIYPI